MAVTRAEFVLVWMLAAVVIVAAGQWLEARQRRPRDVRVFDMAAAQLELRRIERARTAREVRA